MVKTQLTLFWYLEHFSWLRLWWLAVLFITSAVNKKSKKKKVRKSSKLNVQHYQFFHRLWFINISVSLDGCPNCCVDSLYICFESWVIISEINLFNSLPDKISPQTPSANIAPMTSEEAMEILKKSKVKWTQRGSLKKMRIISINHHIIYKYILNRYFKTRLKPPLSTKFGILIFQGQVAVPNSGY